jgi:hypothetical protein
MVNTIIDNIFTATRTDDVVIDLSVSYASEITYILTVHHKTKFYSQYIFMVSTAKLEHELHRGE